MPWARHVDRELLAINSRPTEACALSSLPTLRTARAPAASSPWLTGPRRGFRARSSVAGRAKWRRALTTSRAAPVALDPRLILLYLSARVRFLVIRSSSGEMAVAWFSRTTPRPPRLRVSSRTAPPTRPEPAERRERRSHGAALTPEGTEQFSLASRIRAVVHRRRHLSRARLLRQVRYAASRESCARTRLELGHLQQRARTALPVRALPCNFTGLTLEHSRPRLFLTADNASTRCRERAPAQNARSFLVENHAFCVNPSRTGFARHFPPQERHLYSGAARAATCRVSFGVCTRLAT